MASCECDRLEMIFMKVGKYRFGSVSFFLMLGLEYVYRLHHECVFYDVCPFVCLFVYFVCYCLNSKLLNSFHRFSNTHVIVLGTHAD